MTIGTVLPAPAATVQGTRGGSPAAGEPAAGGFGMLVAQHLATVEADSPSGRPSDPTNILATLEESEESATEEAPASTGLVVLPVLNGAAPVVAGAAVTGQPADAGDVSGAGSATVGATAAAGAVDADGTTVQDAPVNADGRADGKADTELAPRAMVGPTPAHESGTSSPATAAAVESSTPLVEASRGLGSKVDPGSAGGQPEPSPTVATSPIAGAGATTGAGGPTASPATSGSGNAVTAQVFPEIPALVTRGEGTQSITLKLHPADLGEVRVTVTVKNGLVDVTLSAGPEAQEALRTGSGELRSLLDLTGVATGQLIVRDLPTAAAPTSAGSAFNIPDPGHGAGGSSGGNATGDERAGDRSSARTRPGGGEPDTAPQPSSPPSDRTGSPGLDLIL
jgi:flagellar hook-length control protein FliK